MRSSVGCSYKIVLVDTLIRSGRRENRHEMSVDEGNVDSPDVIYELHATMGTAWPRGVPERTPILLGQ
jgi:hypothetical protein